MTTQPVRAKMRCARRFLPVSVAGLLCMRIHRRWIAELVVPEGPVRQAGVKSGCLAEELLSSLSVRRCVSRLWWRIKALLCRIFCARCRPDKGMDLSAARLGRIARRMRERRHAEQRSIARSAHAGRRSCAVMPRRSTCLKVCAVARLVVSKASSGLVTGQQGSQ